MHEPLPIVTIAIIAVTALTSMMGFKDPSFVQRFIFAPEHILRDKQAYRLVTSAFLHADWQHLLFNMYSLYVFGRWIELGKGIPAFLVIYFASIAGGSLLSLYLHRHHLYRAYGASGGVCGIIYAYIFLFPGGGIFVFPFPFAIPAWLYAIAYILLSFYGVRKASDNIGHDAHLGGAIIGLLSATLLYPEIAAESPRLYAAVMLLSIGMFLYLLMHPLYLPLDSPVPAAAKRRPTAMKPPDPAKELEEVNRILDKISRSGINSLTDVEHKMLLKASRNNPREGRN